MKNFFGLPGFGLILQIVLLITITDYLFGQVEIDSLNTLLNRANAPEKKLEILLQLSENELNYQNAVTYAERAKQLADSLGLPFEKAKALNLCGVAWKNCGDIPKSIEHLYSALDYFEKSGDEILYGEVLMNIGESFRASAKRQKSIEYLNMALSIFKKHNDSTGLAKTYNRLAALSYEKLVNFPEYKLFYNINKIERKDFYNELFKIPALKQEHDSLFFYLTKSYYFAQTAKQDEVRVSTEITRAAFYTATFCTDTSVVIYERIMKDIKNSKTYRDLPLVMINLARLYNLKRDFDKSNYFARQTFDFGKKRHIKIYTLLSCFQLRDNYFEEGKFDSAYYWYDTLYHVNNQFRRDELTLELNLLNKENEIKTKEIAIKNHLTQLQLLGVFAFILLVSFSVFTLILLKKNKKLKMFLDELNQKNQIINQKNTELASANAQKDKFFSIIAHDLKSPFNSVMGFSELLVEKVKDKDYDGIVKYAEIILQSSERAVELLMNLMDWARSQTGRMEFIPEHFEMVELINEITFLFEDTAGQKSITIKKMLPHFAPVFADKAMINTVLRNLITNAVKFTKPGGEIIIAATENQTEIVVSVKDNGVGIPQDMLGKLFRIDENFSTPGTNNEKGTGLGLILCKEFIDKHGGKIWVESLEGKGSVFFFAIPCK
jgi:signal transduction histidine kinase